MRFASHRVRTKSRGDVKWMLLAKKKKQTKKEMQLCREQARAEPENREFAVPVQLRVLLPRLGGTLLEGGGTSPVHKATGAGRSFVLVPESLSHGREGKQGEKCRGGGGARVALLLVLCWFCHNKGKRVELHPEHREVPEECWQRWVTR